MRIALASLCVTFSLIFFLLAALLLGLAGYLWMMPGYDAESIWASIRIYATAGAICLVLTSVSVISWLRLVLPKKSADVAPT
jgi:uncharacterized BrkB/YihY/UPF0761 family membrane protein